MNFFRFPYTETIPSKVDRLIDIHLSKAVDIKISNDTTNSDNCFFIGGPVSSLNVLQKLDNSPASYINVDKGYFRSKKTTHWRLTYNNLQQDIIFDVPDDRFNSINHFPIEPWKTDGDYILILAPNPAPLKFYTGSDDILNWCQETKNKILEYTDRKIFIRFKDSCKKRGYDPLSKYLTSCHAVVTLQSIGCVETISAGIPTVNLAPSCLDGLYKSDMSQIENLPRPENRYEWLKSLAYGQFTITEIENGTALSIIKNLYNL